MMDWSLQGTDQFSNYCHKERLHNFKTEKGATLYFKSMDINDNPDFHLGMFVEKEKHSQ